MSNKTAASNAASVLGKQSYKARLERFGIERLQEIARENGKLGGSPKGSEQQPLKATKKGAFTGQSEMARSQDATCASS